MRQGRRSPGRGAPGLVPGAGHPSAGHRSTDEASGPWGLEQSTAAQVRGRARSGRDPTRRQEQGPCTWSPRAVPARRSVPRPAGRARRPTLLLVRQRTPLVPAVVLVPVTAPPRCRASPSARRATAGWAERRPSGPAVPASRGGRPSRPSVEGPERARRVRSLVSLSPGLSCGLRDDCLSAGSPTDLSHDAEDLLDRRLPGGDLHPSVVAKAVHALGDGGLRDLCCR